MAGIFMIFIPSNPLVYIFIIYGLILIEVVLKGHVRINFCF